MCCFTGYPPGYKGYKLLDLQTYEVFISRDVVFHEDIYHFLSKDQHNPPHDLFPDFVLPHISTNIPTIVQQPSFVPGTQTQPLPPQQPTQEQ